MVYRRPTARRRYGIADLPALRFGMEMDYDSRRARLRQQRGISWVSGSRCQPLRVSLRILQRVDYRRQDNRPRGIMHRKSFLIALLVLLPIGALGQTAGWFSAPGFTV